MKTRVSLFKNVTARELLFDGYSDPLLTMGSLFAKPGGIPMDRFGWFYARNGRWESHRSALKLSMEYCPPSAAPGVTGW